jgi:heme-degrading monooxygenase HmoA
MTTAFASGNWVVRESSEATFVDCWRRFLEWTAGAAPGLHRALLLVDNQDGRHFVSVAEWESKANRDAWRAHADFPAHLAACRALCEEFRGADYSLVAAVGSQPQIPDTEQKPDRFLEEARG